MVMKRKKANLVIGILVVTCFFIGNLGTADLAFAEKPIQWKLIASWGKAYLGTRTFVIPWVDRINKRAKGKLKVSWVGPEAVPPFEQLKPVRTGIFDASFTHSAYHAGQIGGGLGMDLILASSEERRKAGLYKILDEAYRKKHNVRYFGALCDGTGYHIMLRDKCTQKADLKGLKIRATPFYQPLVKTLGGVTVLTPGGEIYSALEKGVVDGACWPAFGALDFKWYEVAKHQLRPRFGEPVHPFLINVDSWNKLPKELQDLVTKVTLELEDEFRKTLIARWGEEEKQLVSLGMKVCELPPEEKKKFNDIFYSETWKFVLKVDPKLGPAVKKAVDKLLESRKK